MTQFDQEQTIRSVAESLRTQIISVSPEARPISLRHFPRGSCGDAVDMLATRLAGSPGRSLEYVFGKRVTDDGIEIHAWLQVDGFIVDITADQFDEVDDAVIVKRSSDWHSRWGTRILREAGLDHVVGRSGMQLRAFLERLANASTTTSSPALAADEAWARAAAPVSSPSSGG